MNEELKIIISAVTDGAKKNIQGVSKELKGMETQGKGASAKLGTALKGVGVAAAAAVAAIGAVGVALVALGNKSKEYRQEQAKLNAAFLAAGSTTEQAAQSYNNLFRFLGDSQKATEAAAHLAKLTTNEQDLAEWTTALQGVYATFGDSLPIEGLTEAANETAKVGTVTGTLADALNWAGVNEDAFNAQLAATSSEAEREALIRGTLNSLYNDAAQLYERNNADLIAANEAQARLDATTARVGKTIQPLLTSLTNLANTLLVALAPAIETVSSAFAWFVDKISAAVKWVAAFFGIVTGEQIDVSGITAAGAGIADTQTNLNGAAAGAGALNDNLNGATDAAKELKRVTMGFDELNVVASGNSGGGASGGASGGSSFSPSPLGGGLGDLGTMGNNAAGGVGKIKEALAGLGAYLTEWGALFTPSIEAWGQAFSNLKEPATEAFESVKSSLGGLWENTLKPFGGYLLEEFVPNITNSFSENIAPLFSDVLGFALTEFATHFDWVCQGINTGINDIVMPALEQFETITTDTLDVVGEEWEQSGDTLLNLFSGVIESIRGIWENFYSTVLKPIWDAILEAIDWLWEKHLKGLWENIVSFFAKVGECVMTIWNNFLAPIVNWIIDIVGPAIVSAVKTIISVVSTIVGIIADVVGGILKSLGGLLDFITGVFSGNWDKAWQGICDFFEGIWDAMWGICAGFINLIIDGINALWSGIYSAVKGIVDGIGGIAGAIGDIFGADWHFSMPAEPPRIPKLAEGGIVTKSTLANIGERGKEAVLPLENNTEWMDMLADKIAAKNGTPSKIVLTLDGKELGQATVNAINNLTRQTGKLQLALV